MITLTVVVVLYLFVIGYLGFLGYRKTSGTTDYLLAGRQVHPYVMAVSYGATFISTSAIVGFGGIAGLYGMGILWLVFLNIFIGIFIAFIFFGNRTRLMGYHLDAHTFPEFLGKRFQSKFIQVFAGLVIFVAMPIYAGVVLIGGVRFIETYMGINFDIAMFVFSVIIAAYVIAGGLKGVMYTDALQGTIMFIGMVILLGYTYVELGGFVGAHQALTDLAPRVPEALRKLGHQGWTSMPHFLSVWWWVLVSTIILGVGIGVLAQPQLVVRFMTVKSKRELNRAVFVGGIFILITTGVSYIVGSLSNVWFVRESGQIAVDAAAGNADNIIPLFISSAMPEWFGAVFMVTLLAAAMSTLSSQFHAMGAAMSRDIILQLTGPLKKDRTVLITRLAIFFEILVVMFLGYTLPENIIARGTAIFFGLCASTFLPLYGLGLYWKGVTKAGAKAGLLFGFFGSLLYLLFILKKESSSLGLCQALFGKPSLASFPWIVVDPILIIFPLSILITVLVSLMTKRPDDKHLDLCFRQIK